MSAAIVARLRARAEAEERVAHLARVAWDGTSLPETRPALLHVAQMHEQTARVLREEADAIDALPAAPLGYDAAMRVAVAVWKEAHRWPHDPDGDDRDDLAAIVTRTLGDDAAARAERAVLRLAVDSANREPWCVADPPCGACKACEWIAALDALTVARNTEPGK